MEWRIQITGLTKLVAALEEYPAISYPILQGAVAAGGAVLAKNTIKGVVPWRTGFLTKSFYGDLVGLTYTWYPTASYARFVEFGTAPHDIFPKEGKALFWPGAAHPVRVVYHPGTQAQDYMGAIVARSQPEIEEQFAAALSKIAEEIASQTP